MLCLLQICVCMSLSYLHGTCWNKSLLSVILVHVKIHKKCINYRYMILQKIFSVFTWSKKRCHIFYSFLLEDELSQHGSKISLFGQLHINILTTSFHLSYLSIPQKKVHLFLFRMQPHLMTKQKLQRST